MSSVRVSLPLNPLVLVVRVRAVFTTPGDVSPVVEYDVGKLLDLQVDLKQLSLKDNFLQKMEPSSDPSSHLRNDYRTIEIIHAATSTKNEVVIYAQR